MNAFQKMLKDDEQGIKPLFRNREWKKEEREALKKEKRLNWYKNEKELKIKYKSVLFVPLPLGGCLQKN